MHKLVASEAIPGLSDATVGDFWSWAYSDVLSNVTRSVYAEFLVASALGLTHEPRVEWDAVDLRYRGHGIEVKAAAYLQSWRQERLSTIRFDIARKRAWDARSNTYATEPVRGADCYAFCLYPETDPAKVDVLDARRWCFYVLPTARIEREFGGQKGMALSTLEALASPVRYEALKGAIDGALS